MITRREFIKAFGALVGAGAVGSVIKPVGDVVAGNEAKPAEATSEVPVATDRAAFNYYPIPALTTRCAWVDEHGQTRGVPGVPLTPGKTWPVS